MNYRLIKYSAIIMFSICLISIGAFFAWEELGKAAKGDKPMSFDQKVVCCMMDTEEITTNLLTNHLVITQFRLQTDNKQAKTEVGKRMYQVNNIILKALSSLDESKLQKPEDIKKMENQIASSINLAMQTGKVTDVIMTKKIIE